MRGWLLIALCAVFAFGCRGESTGSEERTEEGASGNVETAAPLTDPPSAATTGGAGVPDEPPTERDTSAPSEPGTATSEPLNPSDASGGTGDPDAPDGVPGPARSVLEHMRTQVAPNFAVPGAEAELRQALSALPELVEDPWKTEFQAVLDAAPTDGSLAATCKQCHFEHRLRFRAEHNALPFQRRTDSSTDSGAR